MRVKKKNLTFRVYRGLARPSVSLWQACQHKRVKFPRKDFLRSISYFRSYFSHEFLFLYFFFLLVFLWGMSIHWQAPGETFRKLKNSNLLYFLSLFSPKPVFHVGILNAKTPVFSKTSKWMGNPGKHRENKTFWRLKPPVKKKSFSCTVANKPWTELY